MGEATTSSPPTSPTIPRASTLAPLAGSKLPIACTASRTRKIDPASGANVLARGIVGDVGDTARQHIGAARRIEVADRMHGIAHAEDRNLLAMDERRECAGA